MFADLTHSIRVQEMDKGTRDSLSKIDQQLDAVATKLEAGVASIKDLMTSVGKAFRQIEARFDIVDARVENIQNVQDSEINKKNFSDLEASLKFPEIHSREESISESHEATFQWIFKAITNAKWSDFSHWLRMDDQFY